MIWDYQADLIKVFSKLTTEFISWVSFNVGAYDIILKPKRKESPVLKIDIDFLRTINVINEGYPVSLLAPHYIQSTSIFLQKLYEEGLTEENEDGEIIIANRKKSYKKSIHIADGKYYFDGEDE